MADLVAVRMTPAFLAQVRAVATEQGFLSVQEYVRDALRRDLYQHYQARLDPIVKRAKTRTITHPSAKERDAQARAFLRETVRKR